MLRNLTELYEGQPVVHIEHGVGRYTGLKIIEVGGINMEYIIITYADNDKLYVPVSSLHLISSYYSSGTTSTQQAPLHKLGSEAWSRSKVKIVKQLRDVAAELLDIHSQRLVKKGFSFNLNIDKYKLFSNGFNFKITPDQEKAINAVLSDMCKPLPMDRLVCGDVGFGKTEVAMRAAFLAIENNKQVAILVPTTLLAQQHFDNFSKRFEKFNICIKMISRFCSKRDEIEIIKKTYEGKVNILIGTHKILQKNIKWRDLGLLIIDEEHRFGVRHKEHIKLMRSDIDILTLTATPIPRTLNMAISGIRDLSIIATPPELRRAVKTFVLEYDNIIVREAILREISRGGQVYYLYNNVKNIDNTARKLKELVPEASIAVGHGQMNERNLEIVMNCFYKKRFNVLICTSIIETGIDIYNVNTIIIEQANQFGLAQLHQLRGRVGRSNHQAYAYLLIKNKKILTKDTRKRLDTISSLDEIGVGFVIATHDLEIRGAGELLGKDQSGQIEKIGFSLYIELLNNAVKSLKSGHEPSWTDLTRSQLTEVELRIPALLPEYYINDINTRLSFYKRIARTVCSNEIDELKKELIYRFGVLPDPAFYLLEITIIRQQAQELGIKRIDGNEKGIVIEIISKHCIDTSYLKELIIQDKVKLDAPMRLRFINELQDYTMRIEYLKMLLSDLYQHRT